MLPRVAVPGLTGTQQRRRLAQALAQPGKGTVILFYSDSCALCLAIRSDMVRLSHDERSWLSVAKLNVDDVGNAPEVLQYNVTAVPCAVLLDLEGAGPWS
jgi:thioredoxin-like negative regulator of GroEL